jgi:hypothetical protein
MPPLAPGTPARRSFLVEATYRATRRFLMSQCGLPEGDAENGYNPRADRMEYPPAIPREPTPADRLRRD